MREPIPRLGRFLRPSRGGLVAVLLAVSWLVPACGTPGNSRSHSATGGSVVVARDLRRVQPEFLQAFALLQQALDEATEEGDQVARRVLDGIYARGPDDPTLEHAAVFERILTGRGHVRALELVLERRPLEDEGRWELALSCSHDRPYALVLHLPPADLEHFVVAIDPGGIESKGFETTLTEAFDGIRLPPGRTQRIPLAEYSLPMGRALALRERWRMELRSGEIGPDGELYPATGISVRACEGYQLASFLSAEPVEPGELTRYSAQPQIATAPLLERAVRIAPERHEETLELLAPLVSRLAEGYPRRVQEIEPALRWLARTNEPGVDPQAWARYLSLRVEAASSPRATSASSAASGGLDLPDGTAKDSPDTGPGTTGPKEEQ